MVEELKYAVVTAGFLLAVLEAGGAFGKPFLGVISDRLLHGSRKKAYLLVCVGWCIGCTLMTFVKQGQTQWLLIPLSFILGMSAIGWSGIHFTYIAELADKELVGTATSLSTIVLGMGGILWSPLIGKIIDMTGGYRMAWLLIACSGALAAILLLFVKDSIKIISRV